MADVRLDSDELIAEARQSAGLEDLGNPRFREGLDVLIETFNSNLDDNGVLLQQRDQLLGRLQTRLRVQDAYNKHPEILKQEIKAPMILTGLPRSGTSALFNLLNSDPRARGLLQWEARFPEPMPGLEPGQPDPRRQALVDAIEANRNPEFDKIHYMSADTPEECVLIHVYSFDGALTGWECLMEPYRSWFEKHSLDFLYEEQRDLMKLLQWQRPGERWLLKSPAHMWGIDQIVKMFPDVSLVWGHREPVGVTASICSMTEMVRGFMVGPMSEQEVAELGPQVMDWYATSLERGLKARAEIDPARVVDYSFTDFVESPADTVKAIYQHFNIEMDAATETALEAHMRENKKGKHGKHEYNLERYGMTEADVHKRYGFYMDHPLIR